MRQDNGGPGGFEHFSRGAPRFGRAPQGPFAKGLAAVLAVVLFGVALMFSLVFVVVALGLGLLAWAWLWWKTRRVRREFEAFHASAASEVRRARPAEGEGSDSAAHRPTASAGDAGRGAIIEGEVIAVEIVRDPSPPDGSPR